MLRVEVVYGHFRRPRARVPSVLSRYVSAPTLRAGVEALVVAWFSRDGVSCGREVCTGPPRHGPDGKMAEKGGSTMGKAREKSRERDVIGCRCQVYNRRSRATHILFCMVPSVPIVFGRDTPLRARRFMSLNIFQNALLLPKSLDAEQRLIF